MKLYAVSDGPPSLACRMVLKALKVPFELVNVNYNIGEHLTEAYAKVSGQSIEIIRQIAHSMSHSAVESPKRNSRA